MKATVKVEIKENWARQKYALFYTDEYNIAELDYPTDGELAKVFPMYDNRYVCFSSLPQGIIGAETAVRAFLFGKGYTEVEIKYPTELKNLRKQAFVDIK